MATKHAQRSRWKNELLPNIVDHLSRETPQALYDEYPISPLSYDAGYHKIAYCDLANAVNGAASWLSQTLGTSKRHEVLAYVGPNDLRYIVLVLAAVKAGYVLFLTSPRNSVPAHVKLFERLECTKLLSPEPKPPPVSTILEAHSMQHVAVPSVVDLLDTKYPHYIYNKTFKEVRSGPFMVIHTSASTGFPKPLIYTNETAARNMSMLAKDPPAGIRSMDRLVQGKRVLNCFPPFHGACLVSHLFAAIPFGTVMIAPLSGAISTAQGVVKALHQTPADAAFLVPSIVLELAEDDAILDYCSKNLERCLYAAGDLPQAVGDKVAAKLPLVCRYGASKVVLTPQLLPEDMSSYDRKYVQFHPCLGTEFREVADGNYELYIKHDEAKENEQPTFTILPDLKENGTRDLFSLHPTLYDLWSWRARADDIIVFLNGEKTNPISMEHHVVAENAEVLTAIVIGTQRFQAALMPEPAPNAIPRDTAEEAAFIERIWPSIQEANKAAPAHAKVEKAMILPMTPNKPVVRTGKGTIQRAATLQQYTAELDRLYQNADMNIGTADKFAKPLEIQEIEAISDAVKTILARASGKTDIDSHDNFFEFGIDSLQALTITRELRQRFRMPEIAIATSYSNPTITKLSEAVELLQSSKFIAEVLCDEASRHLHIPVSIARVGQIAGPVRRKGIWNPAEWVPSLFMSSIHISALPNSLGASLNKVDWIPVDLLAETIVELSVPKDGSLTSTPSGAEVFHIQNPKSTRWSDLLPGIKLTIKSLTSKPIDIVPAKSWLAKVRQDLELRSSSKSSGASENIEVLLRLNPAVKLLDFFSASMGDVEGTNILSLEKARSKSASLRDIGYC